MYQVMFQIDAYLTNIFMSGVFFSVSIYFRGQGVDVVLVNHR